MSGDYEPGRRTISGPRPRWFPPLPAGDYVVQVVMSENLESYSRKNKYLEVTLRVVGGPDDGRFA